MILQKSKKEGNAPDPCVSPDEGKRHCHSVQENLILIVLVLLINFFLRRSKSKMKKK